MNSTNPNLDLTVLNNEQPVRRDARERNANFTNQFHILPDELICHIFAFLKNTEESSIKLMLSCRNFSILVIKDKALGMQMMVMACKVDNLKLVLRILNQEKFKFSVEDQM